MRARLRVPLTNWEAWLINRSVDQLPRSERCRTVAINGESYSLSVYVIIWHVCKRKIKRRKERMEFAERERERPAVEWAIEINITRSHTLY